MAGIEKICELSGEHPGSLMYSYKRNSIQVMPQYRKRFRGAKHTLFIFTEGKKEWEYKSLNAISSYDPDHMNWYEPPFTNVREWENHVKKFDGGRVVVCYDYCLQVTDPSLKGDVDGFYFNWSHHLPTVKRKLKRILRCKKLNIVKVDSTQYEWVTSVMDKVKS